MVLNNIMKIKLIEKKDNIETYEGYMKIKIKKLLIKNEIELYYYKSKLKYKKIYDIKKDNNILYIYYDINEDIEEILIKNEYKEAIIKEHCGPINKNEMLELLKKEDAMCKIKSQKIKNGQLENIFGTGFFLKINIKNIPFEKCLITNNHILDENDIKKNEEIKLEYLNKKKIIEITKDRKVFTNKELDYTCIEIYEKDNIKEYFKIDNQIIKNSIEIYKDRDIFILQYPKGNEISFSNGIILGIKDNNIIHNCSTYNGSSGSPIISRYSDNSIIGLHYGSDNNINLSTNIISIINDIKNYINNNNYFNINNSDKYKINDYKLKKNNYNNIIKNNIKNNNYKYNNLNNNNYNIYLKKKNNNNYNILNAINNNNYNNYINLNNNNKYNILNNTNNNSINYNKNNNININLKQKYNLNNNFNNTYNININNLKKK